MFSERLLLHAGLSYGLEQRSKLSRPVTGSTSRIALHHAGSSARPEKSHEVVVCVTVVWVVLVAVVVDDVAVTVVVLVVWSHELHRIGHVAEMFWNCSPLYPSPYALTT